MTPQQLRELIEQGESLAVEFKSEHANAMNDDELLTNVVCLANRPGQTDPGWLLIGVDDSGNVTGAHPRHRHGATDEFRVQALIGNRTHPPIVVEVHKVAVEGQEVLAIKVLPSRRPIATTSGCYTHRVLGGDGRPSCVPYYYDDMRSMDANVEVLDHSLLALPGVTFDDLDPLEFHRYRRAIRERSPRGDPALLELDDIELAKALGAIDQRHGQVSVRVLGLLLFGREEAIATHIPTHEVAFQVLAAQEVEVNERFNWPLVRALEELETQLRTRNSEQEVLVGFRRVAIPAYSERAFREGVANALTHRDYTRTGTVYVQWHSDRIEISNPGGFPAGVGQDSMLTTQPVQRNPRLADAFKRAGIVERTARGIDTIYYEQVRSGHPIPSYSRSTDHFVMLELRQGKVNPDFVRLVVEQIRRDTELTLNELLLFNQLIERDRLTVAEAAAVIQRSEHAALETLQHLLASGIAEAGESGGVQLFQLSPATKAELRRHADTHY